MKALLVLGLPLVTAWPTVMNMDAQLKAIEKRESPAPGVPQPNVYPPQRKPNFLSKRPNTGASYPIPAPFNADDQRVPTTGKHAFVKPTSSDKRGQCPGLNAAANHGYLPHNGLPTIVDTVTGLGDAYNMSPELAAFLAAVSVALAGDPVLGTWSIGGKFPNTIPLFPATGIVGTHNQYEGDASIIRGDAYMNNGNVGVFQNHKWDYLMAMGDDFNLDKIANQSDYNTRFSKANNPYYFSAPFSGLVAPAAYDFVVNFMSNHSTEIPGGYLNRAILAQFFSVTGDIATPGAYTHNPGLERIPDNWYKRPSAQKYTAADVFTDLAVNEAMYPGIVEFGGNTGKPNTFTGVDPSDFTGGAFNGQTLLQGNNGPCYLLQAASSALPDASDPIVALGGTLFQWFQKQVAPFANQYGCSQLSSFTSTPAFQDCPGSSYKGSGQDGE